LKLKLDENFGNRGAEILRAAGHEVTTVAQQNMCSASDEELIHACLREHRTMVTMDLDFGNPLRYPPTDTAGIAVVRLPANSSAEDLSAALSTLASELTRNSIEGKLWVVQPGRIRIYRSEKD
jgi:predicted nuclease of predicted toxin-antitoxin system